MVHVRSDRRHRFAVEPDQLWAAMARVDDYPGWWPWLRSFEAAGLQAGDQVIAIDGEDMTGTLPENARLRVLGEAGTSVILTIRREGVEEPFDVTVTRAHIVVQSVEYEILEGNIAYVRLNKFS